MKKLAPFKCILFVAFLCLSASIYAKKPVYVEASKFSDFAIKDGARERVDYRYDISRQLIMAITVKGDSEIFIRYDINSKKSKELRLKRDIDKPSQFYCENFSRKKQKEFDVIIEHILSVLSIK